MPLLEEEEVLRACEENAPVEVDGFGGETPYVGGVGGFMY